MKPPQEYDAICMIRTLDGEQRLPKVRTYQSQIELMIQCTWFRHQTNHYPLFSLPVNRLNEDALFSQARKETGFTCSLQTSSDGG